MNGEVVTGSRLSLQHTVLGVIIGLVVAAIIGIPILNTRDEVIKVLKAELEEVSNVPDTSEPGVFNVQLVDVIQEERNHLRKSDRADACQSDTSFKHTASFSHQSTVYVSIKSTTSLEAQLFDFVTPKIQEELGFSHGETITAGGSTEKEIFPGTTVIFDADFAEIWSIGTVLNGDGEILGTFSVRSGLQYDMRPTFAYCDDTAVEVDTDVSTSAFQPRYGNHTGSTALVNYLRPSGSVSEVAFARQSEVDGAILLAYEFDGSNSDWDPFSTAFDDVEMVLVPRGCFELGSTPNQLRYVSSLNQGNAETFDDERHGSRVCIDEPYWIDKYEVTNEQFDDFGANAQQSGFRVDPGLPRENVSWDEAAAYCLMRDGMLPTEEQWAFAARGPDALIFPWGNQFFSDRVAYAGNEIKTVEGDKYAEGASWVGALNMSGNVWEWTDSIYSLYGIEPDEDSTFYVIRGGSIFADDSVHAANRAGSERRNTLVGFRCARSVD